MQVPFLDLKAHHAPIKDEIIAAIQRVIDASAFAGGPFVAEFERDFAAYCQTRFAIGVGNGTDALWLSLLALGIGPGDEVITVPSTFMATAEAISYCGAKPVFVDITARTYTLDPELLEAAITPKIKAIIPVQLFGQMSDMDPILEIANRHHIPVIEDACQAHGATYKGRKAGSIGVTGCFSFYPGKNLGAFGEAGGVVTNDEALARKIQVLRDHGQAKKYEHTEIGWNARMDGIQGAVLKVKLKHLDQSNTARRTHAHRYSQLLPGIDGLITPGEADYGTHIFHVYAIRVKDRDALLRSLTEQGIGCGIHYPIPVHLQAAYRSLGYQRGSFPVAEQCANEFLSLPMFPELTDAQIDLVIQGIRDHIARSSKSYASAS
jgi:dTDP-4-amino-4,6-dideoxygalactose transaminase